MSIRSVYFKNHSCFKTEWAGFDDTVPITLIIGKNNTGKSHLIQLVEALTDKELCDLLYDLNWHVKFEVVLSESKLEQVFGKGTTGGKLGGNHWNDHGSKLVGEKATCKVEDIGLEISLHDESALSRSGYYGLNKASDEIVIERQVKLEDYFRDSHHSLYGKILKHVYADRDIRPERPSNEMILKADGEGATNIIRRFITSSETKFPRELVQRKILDALNEIFDDESSFEEITIQEHDGNSSRVANGEWEIFLGQKHKGLVSLSNSGSGLKTVFLVLMNLILIPVIEEKELKDYIFVFEELENNLHPSLLRRLLIHIESKTSLAGNEIMGCPVFFLTTHSSVALDFFAGSQLSQIVHVTHDGRTGRTRTIDQSAESYDVIWDLGTRPSDILQANGIIWVEGPSDRIYINRWIELYSQGEFKEGRHYQCVFYGGSLLSNLEIKDDDKSADKQLINLFKINPNVVVVSDSDRKSKNSHFKPRVRRIRDEFKNLDPKRTFHWILEAREIENYLLPEFMESIKSVKLEGVAAPKKFESFFPKQGERSYLESKMKRRTFDKSKLATLTVSKMTRNSIESRFDLDKSMQRIIKMIELWNK